LPFLDGSLDLISCAGGLSYLNFEQFVSEAKRVLAPGGVLLCVDSFNVNLIYRFNRYVHYLRGERSKSPLERMPDERMLARLRVIFSDVHVEYFGLMIFCLPILRPFLSEESQTRFLAETDRILFPLRKYSFKILIKASQPQRQ
jgi:SAM-dependent methyltransferase